MTSTRCSPAQPCRDLLRCGWATLLAIEKSWEPPVTSSSRENGGCADPNVLEAGSKVAIPRALDSLDDVAPVMEKGLEDTTPIRDIM